MNAIERIEHYPVAATPRCLAARMRIICFCVIALSGLIGCAHKETFPIQVWLDGTGSPEQLMDGTILDGPCGGTKLVPVSSFSDLSEPDLENVERVYEFDADGAIIAAWYMPVNSYVLGIDGDWIYVSYYSPDALAVSTDGQLRSSEAKDVLYSETSRVKCPDSVIAEFAGPLGVSGYLGCWSIQEYSGGNYRNLSYESICT